MIWDAPAAGRGLRASTGRQGRPGVFGEIVHAGRFGARVDAILLHSKSADFPDGLANSSGVLGRYLMDHTMSTGAKAKFPGWENHGYTGERPNGIYIPRFRNVTEPSPDFIRGYGYQGWSTRQGWSRGLDMPGFGAEYKRQLTEPGVWEFELGAFGECLPREENYIELDPERVDAWGIPASASLRVERQRTHDVQDSADAPGNARAGGGGTVELLTDLTAPGLTIHEMGTARMGRDPATSVLNGYNQAWDAPNLFVIDGAAMPSSACQNPSLTYMALTARACHYARWAKNRGEL